MQKTTFSSSLIGFPPPTSIQEQGPITQLPIELILQIFCFFTGKQVSQLSLVCKQWKILSQGESLWKFLFTRDFPKRVRDKERSFFQEYMIRYRISRQWECGLYSSLKIENPVGRPIKLVVDEDKILGEGPHGSIKIWDKYNGTLMYSLGEHLGVDFGHIKCDADLIIFYFSMGVGGGIKVWDKRKIFNKGQDALLYEVSSGWNYISDNNRLFIAYERLILDKWKGTTVGTLATISKIFIPFILYQENLIIGDDKNTIKIWNRKNGALLHTLQDNDNAEIISLLLDGDFLVSGDNRGVVKRWDLKTHHVIQRLETEAKTKIGSLMVNGNLLLASHHEKDTCFINVWDKETSLLLYSLENCNQYLNPLIEKERIILVSNNHIEVRNKFTGALLPPVFEKFPENDRVESLLLDDDRIIALFRDQGVRVWNIDSGNLLVILEEAKRVVLDGDRLLISLKDGSIQICDFSPKITPF